MDTKEILQSIVEYIDEHIKEELNADTLAKKAGFSTWHFGKLFHWGVGYSVMGYVRKRRLAYAAYELNTDRRILDIAMDYGFETHSGFSKAFRRYYGCSPETYRMHALSERPLPPSLPRAVKYMIGGIVLEPKFVTFPAVKIAGYAIKTNSAGNENNKAIPAFWSDYLSDGRVQKLHSEAFVKSHDEYGACFPADPETGEFEYVIGVATKEGADIPEGYHVCELPPATYAVFSTPPCRQENFSSTIQGVWQYIFSEWFSTSGYEYAPGCVDYELYGDSCMSEDGKICDIYIPVVKKQA